MCKHNYWMLFWNCHIAQETTRESLGLKLIKNIWIISLKKNINIL